MKEINCSCLSALVASSPLKSVIFSSLNSPFTTAVPSQCGAGLETVQWAFSYH